VDEPNELDPLPTEPPASPAKVELDYFAANEPERRRERLARLCVVALLAGWVPYACGVVNALVVARSYSDTITGPHERGAAVFLAAGVAASMLGLIGFLRLRSGAGIFAAAVVLCVQVSLAACMGLVRAA
jgi:hypothetical protein